MRLPTVLILCLAPCAASGQPAKYVAAVREFADSVLKHGRDVYGPKRTPLFVDGVNVDTFEPVKWKSENGREWVLSDLGNQQILFRTLAGLSALTGDARYKNAALDATRYALANLQVEGFLAWGGHMAYNASDDVTVYAEDKSRVHELKNHYPYYELLWEADPAATRQLIETIWNGHILDWSILDFNRHGVPQKRGALWASEYKGGPVFFWGKGLTFINAGSDLYYAAAMLNKFTGAPEPLVWAKRLAYRYVETRNPKTGIGGYQFSQAASSWCDDKGKVRGDRAIYQYGDDFKGHFVVEGTLFPTYGSTPEVRPRLSQMVLGELLGAGGKEFIDWPVEELTAWGKSAYRPKTNEFVPMLTDGTSMEGYVTKKDGYFGPKGRVLAAGHGGPIEFWTYALAYRLSGDAFLWEMARSIALGNGFGDIGATPRATPKLSETVRTSDPMALFAFLELHRKGAAPAFLSAARQVGDNILREKVQKGFFTSGKNYVFARFDRVEPLALLHLAAALEGKTNAVPAYSGGAGFFAAAYGDQGHKYDEFLYRRQR